MSSVVAYEDNDMHGAVMQAADKDSDAVSICSIRCTPFVYDRGTDICFILYIFYYALLSNFKGNVMKPDKSLLSKVRTQACLHRGTG